MYGGRVTCDFDRRVLTTYVGEYMGDFLFDAFQPFKFFASKDFEYGPPLLVFCNTLHYSFYHHKTRAYLRCLCTVEEISLELQGVSCANVVDMHRRYNPERGRHEQSALSSGRLFVVDTPR
jgi:hypothetical protein